MSRSNKAADTDTVSDVSMDGLDSDDSMAEFKENKRKNGGPPKKKQRKDQPKTTANNKHAKQPDGVGPSSKADDDEDNEQAGLAQEFDEENLLDIEIPPRPDFCAQKEGEPRMMITDITVENFKSYYGTRTIGPFHHNFTAIIGPNGSGKSNVIDALLFVFGYKASKIRSKKVSVLIHSSSGKDNLNSCTVRITFQMIRDIPAKKEGGESTYEIVPDRAPIIVSRTAYRNNTSEYRVNGNRKTFKEVAVILKEVGIDLIHNRFLILQGEVEQIAMMKPKAVKDGEDGMLEYLEDIIGSSRYKLPIEHLAAKLEKLQAERNRQTAKVNEANRAKEALDGPVQTELTYLSMENEAAALKCKQYLMKKYKAEDRLEEFKPKHDDKEAELAKVAADLAQAGEQLKEKKQALDKMEKDSAALQTSLHKISGELEDLNQKEKKRQNDLNRLNTEMKKMEADVKKDEERLESAKRAPEEAKAKMEEVIGQLEETKEQQAKAQEMFDKNFPEYNEQTAGDRSRKAKLEEEYDGVAGRLAEADSKCKVAASALRSLVEEYEKKKSRLEEVEKSLRGNQERVEKDKESRDKARADMDEHEARLTTITQEMAAIDARVTEIRKRQAELAPMFTEKQQEAQQRQTMSLVSKTFEDAQKNGKMKGWLGRMGDLGTIDKKYDRAISNNYGFSLDMHLGETHHVGAEGTEILKGLGKRGFFLSLEKQQKFWSQIKKIEAEKNSPAPRLFTQIACDDKYKPAFFFAVRWAFVVETIDDATQLHQQLAAANKRENIVCMDGNMIRSNGTYVGGGQVIEGKMGTGARAAARRPSAVREDEAAARKLQEAVAEARTLDSELQEAVSKRRTLQLEADVRLRPIESSKRSVEGLDRQIKSLEERIRVMEGQRAERERDMQAARVDDSVVEQKREEIEQLKKEKAAIGEDSKSFKARIKEIDNEMAKVFAKLVKPHEKERDAAAAAIGALEKDRAKQQAIINGSDRMIKKAQAQLDDVNKTMEQKRKKAEELKELEADFEQTRAEKAGQMEQQEKERAEITEAIKEMRENAGELDKQEVALQKQQRLLTEEFDKIKAEIKGLNRAIDDHNKVISELQLHNIAELMFDVPDDLHGSANARRFLLDGESDDDLDGYEDFMTCSKDKDSREAKQIGKEEAKRRKMTVDEEEEEGGMEDTVVAPTGGAEDAPSMEEEEGEEETEEQRRARKAQIKREKKQRADEMLRSGKMPEWSRRHIQRIDEEELKINRNDLDQRLTAMKKHLQRHVLADYKVKVARLREENAALAAIKEKYNAHRDKLDAFKRDRLGEFMEGFETIASALRELYQMITLGGDASLELKDVIDPFLEGVQFMVRPPKKSWKQIENLSGGEKTLSSLALVFALHRFRPTPLYVMDEIDAALDFRNVSIIGHMVKDRTKNAQFIIISLRNNMFELADRLVGIYKVHDCTRNVVVDPKKIIAESEKLQYEPHVRELMAANTIKSSS